MSRVRLSFPREFFNTEFLKIADSGLGIRGDQLQYLLKEKVDDSKQNKGLFDPRFYYCCKSVHNKIILVGCNN